MKQPAQASMNGQGDDRPPPRPSSLSKAALTEASTQRSPPPNISPRAEASTI